MRKRLIILMVFFLSFFMYAEEKMCEDIKIQQLKNDIEKIQGKIKILERAKKIREEKGVERSHKIGLVLSGGGAKGLAHIGVLRTLEEKGIKIDYIAGTSMGAVVGALYSVGYSPDEIEEVMTEIDWINILKDFPDRDDIPLDEKLVSERYSASIIFDKELNIYFPRGVKQGQKIYLKLKELLWTSSNIKNFDDLPIPVRIIATDLDSGKAKSFEEGDLAKILNASIAIPTVFGPVEIDGKNYVDGLVSRNFPVEDVIDMGSDIVIGVDVGTQIRGRGEYNILTVLDQIVAIQSNSSTPEQKSLATYLIEPDMSIYKTTDFDKAKEIIKIGKEEADSVLWGDLGKADSGERKLLENRRADKVMIKNLILSGNNKLSEEMVRGIFGKNIPGDVTEKEVEELVLNLYALSYIEKVYYEIKDGNLHLEVLERPSNYLRLGVNYNSEYGTAIALGTDIVNIGKSGSRTMLDFKFGDYLGVNARHYMYYGLANKVGAMFNIGYNETPFFLYEGDHRTSEFTSETIEITAALATQFENQFLMAYGISHKFSNLNQDIGTLAGKDLEYDEKYGNLFLKMELDKVDNKIYPSRGVRTDIQYTWGSDIGGGDLSFYGPLYLLEGYIPITKKFSLTTAIGGGSVNGEDILPNEYFKLGGVRNDTSNKSFSFYGYNSQRKIIKELAMGQLGFQYRFLSNFYLTGKWNIATYTGSPIQGESKKIWEDDISGYGLTLGLDSPFGPMELTFMEDSDTNKILSQFNIGYIF